MGKYNKDIGDYLTTADPEILDLMHAIGRGVITDHGRRLDIINSATNEVRKHFGLNKVDPVLDQLIEVLKEFGTEFTEEEV